MQFEVLPESSHELVSLRPIVEEDLPAWYEYLSVPSVFEHTSWNLTSFADLSPYVWAPASRTESTLLRLAIVLRSTGAFVGTVGFHTVSPQNRSAELAYDLAPSVWGKGIASYACSLLVSWAHTRAGILRVQATVLESNLRSKAVLRRCGFLEEGAASQLSSGSRSAGQLLHVFACRASSSSHLTPPSSGQPPASFAGFRLPLMSNVRGHPHALRPPRVVRSCRRGCARRKVAGVISALNAAL